MTAGSQTQGTALWPGNHRAAMTVIVEVDALDLEHVNGPPPAPGLDYAADGLRRIFEHLDDIDVPATFAWSSHALGALPMLVRQSAERGHEVAISLADGRSTSEHVVEQLASADRLTGQQVKGIVALGPAPLPDPIGQVAGFDQGSWTATAGGGDLPQAIGSIVSIPTSPYYNDLAWLHPDRPLPPSSMLEVVVTGLDAARSGQYLLPLVVHPHVIGRPGFSAVLARLLDDAIAAEDVWIARADQVAAWWTTRTGNDVVPGQ